MQIRGKEVEQTTIFFIAESVQGIPDVPFIIGKDLKLSS